MPKHTMAGIEYHCPDCVSESKLEQVAPGVWVMQVAHDTTCPILRQKEAGR